MPLFHVLPFRAIPLMAVALISPAPAAPLIVAHRGASHDAPENTLPAFEAAWKQGADAIEGDFQLTSDGAILCIHDLDTKRVSGIRKVVKNSTLAELRKLDAGAWFGPKWKGTVMPTFAEVAATVPTGRKLFIEVKCGPEIIPALLREMVHSGLDASQMVVISFQVPVIREFKKQAPGFKAYWLSSFAKSSPLDPGAIEVLTTLRETRADGFSSKADSRIGETFLAPILSAGFEYHCWTVDDPKIARRFDGLGARSITTNRPALLRAAIDSESPAR